jgi:NADPH:quinone reductase-like Zn-dependent oxidoreductase
VRRFKTGDRVFGSAGLNFGTNAEYITLPEDGDLAPIPANMTAEEAATVPFGGRDALHFLRKANIRDGQRVLIIGAGGSIGTYAIQLAKYYGAEVTAVDSSPKLEMLRSLGAKHVIDYETEEVYKRGVTYDVIFDVVGKSSYRRCLRLLSKNGFYLLANPHLVHKLRGIATSIIRGKTVVSAVSNPTAEDLIFLKGLIESGNLVSVIDRKYPLERTAEAHAYVDTGQKKGNVVITILK